MMQSHHMNHYRSEYMTLVVAVMDDLSFHYRNDGRMLVLMGLSRIHVIASLVTCSLGWGRSQFRC